MATLRVIGLFVLPLGLGHLFYRAFAPGHEEGSLSEVLFIQVLTGFLLCGWPALILAEVGVFTLARLATLLLLGSAAVVVTRWPHVRSWRWPRPRVDGRGLLAVALFLAAAVLMAWPGERILGGSDAGVYLATAASIARTGGITLQDPAIASMPPQLRTALLSNYIGQWWQLPGFYVTDLNTGQVTPQFLHLYPTWLALFYRAGGLALTLRAFPVFTLLGLAAFFFLARRLLGKWAAPAALALLMLNPAQLWFSREPVSEPFAMALLLGGWYLFERAMREPARRDLAVLAGLSLGQLALAKVEFLILPLLLAGHFLLRGLSTRLQANERLFLCTYALMLGHAAAHAALISRPYLLTFLTSLEKSRFLSRSAVAILALVAIAVAVVLYAFRKWLTPRLNGLGRRPQLLRSGAALLWLLLVLYGAVIRPLCAPVWLEVQGQWLYNYERLTFLRLAWYLSPVGLALATLGLCWWSLRRIEGPSVPFFGTLLFELGIYIHRTMDYPFHFWMMRRYIPLIFPCLTLGIAVALQRVRLAPLSRPVRRGSTIVLLGLLLLQAVRVDSPLASRREMAGTVVTLQELAGKVPDRSPLFIEQFGPAFATPLRYHFGRQAYALPQPIPWNALWALLREWPAGGEPTYLLLEHLPAELHGGTSLIQSDTFRLEVTTTEESLDHLPQAELLLRSVQRLYRVQQRPDAPASVGISLTSPIWTPACITVSLATPPAPLRLQLLGAGFRPETVPPAHLWVLWEGQRVAEIVLDRGKELRQIELSLLPPAVLDSLSPEVHLAICSETWNPKAVGYNDDDRDLGIMLKSVILEPATIPP